MLQQILFQDIGRLIPSSESNNVCIGTQRSDIQRHVARTARPLLYLAHMHNRYRCLWRDTRGITVPVAVKHDITNH